MSKGANNTALLKSLGLELTKEHQVYDGSNRVIEFYQAVTGATNGEPCLRIDYTYDGATSRIVGRKETEVTWNSAWDI